MSELDQDYDDDDVDLIDDADVDAAEADGADDDADAVPAATAISVLDFLVTSLVDDPDAVRDRPDRAARHACASRSASAPTTWAA